MKNKVIKFGVGDHVIYYGDVIKCFRKVSDNSVDLVFADPPYNLENISDLPNYIFSNNILEKNGILIIEHDKNTDFSESPYFKNVRQYGRVMFSFFNFIA